MNSRLPTNAKTTLRGTTAWSSVLSHLTMQLKRAKPHSRTRKALPQRDRNKPNRYQNFKANSNRLTPNQTKPAKPRQKKRLTWWRQKSSQRWSITTPKKKRRLKKKPKFKLIHLFLKKTVRKMKVQYRSSLVTQLPSTSSLRCTWRLYRRWKQWSINSLTRRRLNVRTDHSSRWCVSKAICSRCTGLSCQTTQGTSIWTQLKASWSLTRTQTSSHTRLIIWLTYWTSRWSSSCENLDGFLKMDFTTSGSWHLIKRTFFMITTLTWWTLR